MALQEIQYPYPQVETNGVEHEQEAHGQVLSKFNNHRASLSLLVPGSQNEDEVANQIKDALYERYGRFIEEERLMAIEQSK